MNNLPAKLKRVGRGGFLGHKITIYHDPDAPLFNGREVCETLSIKNPKDAFSRLDGDEKVVGITDHLSHGQQMIFLTESGLYHLIFLCRKPEAKAFRKWITSEVIPCLRRFGRYPASGQPSAVIPKLTVKLDFVLPKEAKALPLRRQFRLAKRVLVARTAEAFPRASLHTLAICSGMSISAAGRWKRQYLASGNDWRSLIPQFDKCGRKPVIKEMAV